MGAGKSQVGEELAHSLSYPFIDLDKSIEALIGSSITSYFSRYGENAFRIIEKKLLLEIANKQDKFVMACGGGTPCFDDTIQFMKEMGKVIWLNPDPSVLWKRLVMGKQERPLIADLNEEQLADYIAEKLKERHPFYAQADFVYCEEQAALPFILNWLSHAKN
jgi:shikimate kinase